MADHQFPHRVDLSKGGTVSSFPLRVDAGTDLTTLVGTDVPVNPHNTIRDGESFVFSKEKRLVGDTTHVMLRRGDVAEKVHGVVARVDSFMDATVHIEAAL